MGNYILNIAFFIMIVISISEARSDGSIPLSACLDMVPGHGGTTQTVPTPYEISTTYSSMFIPGKKLPVDLHGSPTQFKGFYCQAKEDMSNLTVGQFTEIDDMPGVRGHNCFNSELYDTVSHSSQWSQNTSLERTFLTLNWKTTFDSFWRIRFRCTFVQSYNVFWIDVQSEIILSMRNVTAEECCVIDSVPIGCAPLCRHASEEPTNLNLARQTLETITNDDAACWFFYAFQSLRCSYWSKKLFPDAWWEGPTGSFLGDNLKECCVAKNVSQYCMQFCDIDYYAEFELEGDFEQCLTENKELSLCIIYPAVGSPSPESTDATPATTEPTTSAIPTMILSPDTTAHPLSTQHTTLHTTSQPTSTNIRSDGTTVGMPNTVPVTSIPTTNNFHETTIETLDSVAQSTTSFISPSTTINRLKTTMDVFESVTQTTASLTSSAFGNLPETTSPQLEDGIVIYLITTTINVEDVIGDTILQRRIFDGLKRDLLEPGLVTLPGYIDVLVGVEVNEGSLIVLSEGRFLQQDDNSVPTLQSVENSLQNRLDNEGGQISEGGDSWFITRPISVQRKAINGLCTDVRCESSQNCVEVSGNNFLCLCRNKNSEEKICVDETEELSTGVIVGIAVGIVVILAIVFGVFFPRRTNVSQSSKKLENSQKQKHLSANNETYVDPDNVNENNGEHIYSSIPYGDRPPVLPPSNLVTLPSNSTTYDRPISNEEQTESGHYKECDRKYEEPITSKGEAFATNIPPQRNTTDRQPATITFNDMSISETGYSVSYDSPDSTEVSQHEKQSIKESASSESCDLPDYTEVSQHEPQRTEEPGYSVPYDLPESTEASEHVQQGIEEETAIAIDGKDDIKMSTEYSEEIYALGNESIIEKTDSQKTDTSSERKKSISSSELQANGYITFDKQNE